MVDNTRDQVTENWVVYDKYRYNYRYIKSDTPQMAPMLFLCGAFQTSESWRRFENYFSSIADVIVVELPGNGRSDTLPASYGVGYYRQALLKVFDDLELSRAYLIAASYGTPIAYDFAQHFPQKVERLVLAGTMRMIPAHMKSTILSSLKSIEQGDMKEFTRIATDALSSKALLDKSARYSLGVRVLRTQLSKYSIDEQSKYLENTRRLLNMQPLSLSSPPPVKTLVFTGEYDEFTRPKLCEEIARAIPGAHFVTIKNADHLFHFQQFKTTASLLEKFGKDEEIYHLPGCHYKSESKESAA